MTRTVIALGLVIAVLALALGWLVFKGNPWKARATTAETQAALNTTTGAIADRAGETTTRIIVQSEGLAHEVETAPGGDAPLPAGVRDSWQSSIQRMRERPAADPSADTHQPAP